MNIPHKTRNKGFDGSITLTAGALYHRVPIDICLQQVFWLSDLPSGCGLPIRVNPSSGHT